MVKKKSRKKAKKSSRSVGSFSFSRRDSVAVGVFVLAVVLALLFPSFSGDGPVKLDIVEIVSSGCSDCFDISTLTQGFESQVGVEVRSKRSIEFDSVEARGLMKLHDISTVPALVVTSKKIASLPSNEVLEISGRTGVFKRSVPYLDVASGEVVGVVRLTEIRSTCGDDCPKAEQVRVQLENIGVKIADTVSVDETSAEGQALIERVGLTFTPAVILSTEIEEYWWVFPQISDAFLQKDAGYVFKSPVPPYKDLASQEIKGKVKVTYITDASCEGCFEPDLLKKSFEDFGVFFSEEQSVAVDSALGKALVLKYNISKVPTVIFSKDIVEYIPLQETLNNLGTFEKLDQSFVVRNIGALQAKFNTI